jgi:hypothetical protein
MQSSDSIKVALLASRAQSIPNLLNCYAFNASTPYGTG